MKIVHVITRLIVGGAQENTLLSCEGQHARGHEVTLLTGPAIGPEGSLIERARGGGFRIEMIDSMRRAISPINDWRAHQELVRRLRDIRPDVVHTHSSKAGIIGRRAARIATVPRVVHTIHGLAFTASTSTFVNSIYKRLEKYAAPMTDKIVCVADAMRDQSLAAGIGRPEQYVTVYSGMDVEPFLNPPVRRDEIRKQLGLKAGDLAVGTIARLFDLKGHDDLIEIAPFLCAKFPNLKFVWIGDGSLRATLEKQIEMLGLRDRFILTGLVSPAEIPQFVNALDILVHPSRREGLARALPQGALAGLPVVAYDVDGNREGLIDQKTGFLLPAFDRNAMRDAIATLAADENLRREMGRAGRDFAGSRFDKNMMIEALEKVYASINRDTGS